VQNYFATTKNNSIFIRAFYIDLNDRKEMNNFLMQSFYYLDKNVIYLFEIYEIIIRIA